MGGIGSSRWNLHEKRITVQECLALDINKLVRGGLMTSGDISGSIKFSRSASSQLIAPIRFIVWTNGFERPILHLFLPLDLGAGERYVEQQIRLQTTKPYFGGVRWWFTCPLRSEVNFCNGRVGKLYLPPNAHYFACRTCHGLTYRSCQESDKRVSFLKRNPQMILTALNGHCRDFSELRLIEKAMKWFHERGLSISSGLQ